MDISEIKIIRGLCKSIKIKKAKRISTNEYEKDENGNIVYFEEEPTLVLKLDNEHSIEEDIHGLIWDDVHQIVIGFRSNCQTSNAFMIGQDKVELPVTMAIFDYTEIQSIQVVLNEEAFNKYCEVFKDPSKYLAAVGNTTTWKVEDQFTDDVQRNLYNMFFDATNPSATIPIKLKPPQQTFSGMYEDKNGILNK